MRDAKGVSVSGLVNASQQSSRAPRNWRDLRARVLSASLLVPAAGFCVWYGGFLFSAMILFVAGGMAYENARLFGLSVRSWRGCLYVLWPVVACLAALRGEWGAALGVGMVAFIFGPFLWLGMMLIISASTALLWLRFVAEPPISSVLFVIACVVASDSSAYLVGRIFGGPKLAPRISPAKTWSGSVGGLVGGMIAGAAVAALSPSAAPSAAICGGLFGAVMAVAAQAGDLAESALKRRQGVKDSGSIIPGHGGLLDRFDGLLIAAPVAAVCSLGVTSGAFWYLKPALVLAWLLGTN